MDPESAKIMSFWQVSLSFRKCVKSDEKGYYAMCLQGWATCEKRVIMPCANNDDQPVRKGSLCHVQTMMINLWEKGHYAMCKRWWATCEKRVIMPCANNCEQPVTRAIMPCANNDDQPVRKGSLCHVQTMMINLWEKGHYAMCKQWWSTCEKRVIMPCANNDEQPVRKVSLCHVRTIVSNLWQEPLCHVQTMMINLWEKGHYAMCKQWWSTCEKRVIMPCANNDEQPVRKVSLCHVRTIVSNLWQEPLCHVQTMMINLWEKGHYAMCKQWWSTCEKRVIMPCAYNDEQPVRKGSLCHVRTIVSNLWQESLYHVWPMMNNLWEKGHYSMCEQWWATCEKRVIMPCANSDERPVRKGSLWHVRTMMSNLWEKGHYAMCEQWLATCDKSHYTICEQWWTTFEKRVIFPCVNNDEQPVRKGSLCHVRTMMSNVSEQGHYTLMNNLWVKVNYAMCEQWCETCEKRVIMPCANNDE